MASQTQTEAAEGSRLIERSMEAMEAIQKSSGDVRAHGASMSWRGATIPLVDLRKRESGPTAGGHVLVAQGEQGAAGYVVTRVRSLIPAGAGKLYRMGAGRQVQFITVGEGTEQASYHIVELAACA